MAPESDTPHGQISAQRLGEAIELAIPLPDGRVLRLRWSLDQAFSVAAELLQLSAQAAPAPRSLFAGPSLLSASNPRMEYQRSDLGQLVIAVQLAGLRPITIHLDPDQARDHRDAVDAALRD